MCQKEEDGGYPASCLAAKPCRQLLQLERVPALCMKAEVLPCQQVCQPVNHICTWQPPMPSVSWSTGAAQLSEQHVLHSAASCSTPHVVVFFKI